MKFLLADLLLLVSLSELHSKVISPENERTLNSYITTSMKCHNIPGMALTIVKGDQVWSRGYGTANLDTDEDVTADSVFNIGSLTKSFTATLLGMLLAEKRLKWTTKVTDILGPGYEFVDVYRTKELTLKDLLSHRTGLARLDMGFVSGYPRTVSREELCKRMKYLPEEKPLRDEFIYNNYMYMMLGHVAEVLGQDTWENLITSRILQPLGMNNTAILSSPTDLLKPNSARPYIYLYEEFRNSTLELYNLHPWEPASAILSTASDMAKWINFHLNIGKTESGSRLIDKDMMEDMYHVTTAIPSLFGMASLTKPKYPADDIVNGYGYGWFISEYRGYRKVWHIGTIGSYRSALWVFPDMDIGLFSIVNGPGISDNGYEHNLLTLYHIADYMLGVDRWLNGSTVCTFPEPWDKKPDVQIPALETPLPVHNMAELVGSYHSNLFPGIEVSSNSSNLFLRSNRVHGILQPSSEKDRFLYEITYPPEMTSHENTTEILFNVTFNRDVATYGITSLTIQFEVPITYNKSPGIQPVG